MKKSKEKKFVIFYEMLFYNYFSKGTFFGRIETAQGANIAHAPLQRFTFPDLPLRVLDRLNIDDLTFEGILCWEQKWRSNLAAELTAAESEY